MKVNILAALSLFENISQRDINSANAIFRLLLALIAGALVGLERESHAKPAGFRTYIVICVASCLLMLLSIYIPQEFFDFKNGDPGRIASQVVTGIGFLGAGAIIRFGVTVKGMTSAATIWAVAAIGMALGCGFYLPAAVAVLITLFTLHILEIFEEKYLGWKFYKKLTIVCSRKPGVLDELKAIMQKHNLKIFDWSMEERKDEEKITYSIITRLSETMEPNKLFDDFRKTDGVLRIKVR